MNANKSATQIEGHQSAPASPSLSICSNEDYEEIDTTEKKRSPPPPKPPKSLIIRDYDSLDSDNYDEDEGQQIVDLYDNNNNNNNNNNNDNDSVHNAEIFMNLPESPQKGRKKHKHKHKKHKRKHKKRKMKNQDGKQPKKKMKIVPISLISDDENASNISYSNLSDKGDKNNPIYISDNDSNSDPPNNQQPKSFKIEEKKAELDLCNEISNMNLNDQMELSDNLSNLRIQIGNNNNNNNNRRTRRASPPPNPHNAWNINPLTKKAMMQSNDFKVPTKEMVLLVDTINNCKKNIMYSDTNSKNRLLTIIVSLLEIIHRQNINNVYSNNAKILLIAPRRHLALEARELLLKVGKFFKINCCTLIGGMPTFQCIKALSKMSQEGFVITGTPGKLCSMIRQKRLNLQHLVAIAFNGADELKSMRNQMHEITYALPQRIRVLYYESMMTPHSSQEGKEMIRNIDKSIGNMSSERDRIESIHRKKQPICKRMKKIKHVVKYVRDSKYDKEKKYYALFKVLTHWKNEDCIIYFNRRDEKDKVFEYIKTRNAEFMMSSLDGSADNERRTTTIDTFIQTGGMFFVTDLMNDNTFQDVVVINYDVPKFNPIQTYAKRVCSSNGRIACSIVDEFAQNSLNQIISYFGIMVDYNEFSR